MLRLKKLTAFILALVMIVGLIVIPDFTPTALATVPEIGVDIYTSNTMGGGGWVFEITLKKYSKDGVFYKDAAGNVFTAGDVSGAVSVKPSGGGKALIGAGVTQSIGDPLYIALVVKTLEPGIYTVDVALDKIFYKDSTTSTITQYAASGTYSYEFKYGDSGGDSGGDSNDVNVPATSASSSSLTLTTTSFSVNLSDGKLTTQSGYSVAGYSLDGSKWKSGSPSDKDMTNLLSKGGTLKLTDDFDAKKKKPTDSTAVVVFPKIDAAPKANPDKVKPYYDGDFWFLSKDGKSGASGYEYVLASSDKKTPDGEWKPFPDYGLHVDNSVNSDGTKIDKKTYLFRVPPKATGGTYKAGSKIWKVTPAQKAKPKNYKVNYKTETIKVGKDTFNVSHDLDSGETSFYIDGRGGTSKKPDSMSTTVKLATRSDAPSSAPGVDAKGKKLSDIKELEFSKDGTKDWGKCPAITSACELYIRKKANAKVNKSGITGNAAGKAVKISISWGVVDEEKKTNGITGVQIAT